MKHNKKVTAILVGMFLLTQLIGLWVVNEYNNPETTLPYGMEPPEEIKQNPSNFPIHIIIAFTIAIFLLLILTKIDAEKFLRAWFFIVTIIAIALTLNVILLKLSLTQTTIIALILALPLAFFKIYKRHLIVHNITELIIYPGIAAVFVPILGILGIILLLLAISLYDIWAVWHSRFMEKIAKYQINNLKIFGGFFLPYAGKKQRLKIRQIKSKYKEKGIKVLEKQLNKAKIKVNLAILGGGDIIFPIITAGVFFRTLGLIPALIITAFATLSLIGLFMLARKGKFYPAMPFITIGMYLGMIVTWLII